MLIEFSVENFRSIRDEARLSMVASSGKELVESNAMEPAMPAGVKPLPLLRSAALYGPNAGGKSNVLKALSSMREIIMTSSQNLQDLPITPFKLNAESINAPSVFEAIILVEGVRYQYGFSAKSTQVVEEWLFAFPKGKTQTWFERSLNEQGEYDYRFGDKLTGDKDVWKRATRPNALFLSTAIQLNSRQLRPLFNWFANTLKIKSVLGWSPHFSMKWCEDKKKQDILNFLKAADFAISDIQINDALKTRRIPIPPEITDLESFDVFDHLPPLKLSTFHQSNDGKAIEFDFSEESDGTKKMFSFAAPWLDALNQGQVLFVDELHDNLHPLLVKFLVQLFHSNETNPNNAQLVFSTHETSILNQDVFRRDQIWFCERDNEQNTRLFPLTEFSPRKGVENLERAYLSGRYGALPFSRDINENFGG